MTALNMAQGTSTSPQLGEAIVKHHNTDHTIFRHTTFSKGNDVAHARNLNSQWFGRLLYMMSALVSPWSRTTRLNSSHGYRITRDTCTFILV